jgi:hypothetical protein
MIPTQVTWDAVGEKYAWPKPLTQTLLTYLGPRTVFRAVPLGLIVRIVPEPNSIFVPSCDQST